MSLVETNESSAEDDNLPLALGEYKYDWSVKTKAVSMFMETGNLRLTAEKLNIPYNTIQSWKKTEWWPTLVDEVRLIKKSNANKKIEKIIEEGIEVISDRLQNGDWILNNKTGELVRKPVSLRDATQITNALMTRQIQMEEIAAKMNHREHSMQDVLGILAKEFQKWNRITNNKNATTVEFVEVEEEQ